MRGFALAVLAAMGLGYPSGAATVSEVESVSPLPPQGQRYYAPRVSQITNVARSVCTVSTGTDWKATAQVRRASEVDLRRKRVGFDEAFAASETIDLGDLASNTPYVMFHVLPDQPELFRVGLGFPVKPGSLRFEQAGVDPFKGASVWVDPRGDSVAIRTIELDKSGNGQIGIGSGLVYDSDARSEYDECLLKMKFLDLKVPDFSLIETIGATPERGLILLLKSRFMVPKLMRSRMPGRCASETSIPR